MMQVLDAFPPVAAGGSCFLNRANYRGRCVDTGVDSDFDDPLPYGRICLSESTVGHYARLLGWVSPVEAAQLADRIDDLEDALADAEQARDKALAAVEAFTALRSALEDVPA